MSGHSNFEESGEGPGIGSSLFSLFCYSAILLFRRATMPALPASPPCRRRCDMVRIPCDINTRATHTTPQCERRRARHRQALPRLRCRAHPLGFARSVRGGRCACCNIRAFRCFSHASYMARGERVRHRLLPSSHKVCAALRNAVAASRPLRTSLGSWR